MEQSSVNDDSFLDFDFGGFELAYFDCELPIYDDVICSDRG